MVFMTIVNSFWFTTRDTLDIEEKLFQNFYIQSKIGLDSLMAKVTLFKVNRFTHGYYCWLLLQFVFR